MVLYDITDAVSRSVEGVQNGIQEMLFEPTLRLGVTGLSRAGKTVFITSLVSNLLDRGRMRQLSAAADGRILSAFLQPQPDDDVPRFDYETHRTALDGPSPAWPASTRAISQLRLSLRVQPSGMLGSLRGPRTLHLDIIDYPGEWLLDLPLMDQTYAQWSAGALDLARKPARAETARPWLSELGTVDAAGKLVETVATSLSDKFKAYLAASREAGFSACAPGRFLMPGDLAGSPALTFAPLEPPERARSGSLWREFERRFEAYKRVVVKPFFRNHFARLDRQIVLVDVLGAIHAGPQALVDMSDALTDILTAFRPGQNSWLAPLLGKRIDKILFAATKADHLHHSQHAALEGVMAALVRKARDRANHSGADTETMALASLRATVEHEIQQGGEQFKAVKGKLLETGRTAALYAGTLPTDPSHILAPARQGAEDWLDHDYNVMRFAPPVLDLAPGEGPPHIRLDRAAEFLIGDRLR